VVSRAFVDGRDAGELPGRSLEFFVRRFPAADNPGPLAWLPTPLCRVAGPTWLAPSDKVRLSRVEEPPVRDSALLCTRSNHSLTFSWKAADGCEAWKTFAREVDGSDDEERARAVVGPLSGTPPSAGSRFLGRKWALRLTSLRPSLHTRRSWIGGSCAFGVSAELKAESVRSKAGMACASRFWSTPVILSPGATTGVAAALHTAFRHDNNKDVALESPFGSNFGLPRRNAETQMVDQITVMNAHSSSKSI